MTAKFELRILRNGPATDDDPWMQCSSREDAMRKAQGFLSQAQDQIGAIHLDTYEGVVRTASEQIYPAQ